MTPLPACRTHERAFDITPTDAPGDGRIDRIHGTADPGDEARAFVVDLSTGTVDGGSA